MTVTAVGVINIPQQILADTLAACPALLARIGRTAPETAADHIYFTDWVDTATTPAEPALPILVIAIPDGSPIYEYAAGGDQIFLSVVNNGLTLEIRDVRRYPTTPQDDERDFSNFVSALIEYIADKSGQSGHLEITQISWGMTPRKESPVRKQSTEQTWQCRFNLQWGITG